MKLGRPKEKTGILLNGKGRKILKSSMTLPKVSWNFSRKELMEQVLKELNLTIFSKEDWVTVTSFAFCLHLLRSPRGSDNYLLTLNIINGVSMDANSLRTEPQFKYS